MHFTNVIVNIIGLMRVKYSGPEVQKIDVLLKLVGLILSLWKYRIKGAGNEPGSAKEGFWKASIGKHTERYTAIVAGGYAV